MKTIMKWLDRTCALASPSGSEEAAAKELAFAAAPLVTEVTRDALGNLILHKKGDGARIAVAAHLDTIGFLATHREECGVMRFGALGGVALPDILHAPVRFLSGARGVIGCDGGVAEKDRKITHYFLDTEDIQPGERAVFDVPLTRIGEHRICGAYLDNRVGIAAVLTALEELKDSPNDIYAVLTVQEEVGCRGAECAAFALEPDLALAVDVTDAGDTPGFTPAMDTKLGGGAAIKILDQAAIANPAVVELLERTAKQEKLTVQREILCGGGTDAGAFQRSRSGVPSGGIAIPTRYIHSPREVADLRDIRCAATLLRGVLEHPIPAQF